MTRLAVAVSIFALIGVIPTAHAQGHLEKYDGKTVAKNVKSVMSGYQWMESLGAAQAVAKKKHKMVFYLQMVGISMAVCEAPVAL